MHGLGRWRRGWWLLALIAALLLPTAVQAQSKTLYWESYQVQIDVQTNGDLLVTEEQSIAFTSGTFRYGYRTIPLDQTDGIGDIQIWEGNRQYTESRSQGEYTFTVDEEDNELVVNWYFPPTSNSRHTYTFRYVVRGGVKINPNEGDSIFWKAIPPDHSFPIQQARVVVRFPPGVDLGDIVSFGVPTEYSVENNAVTFASTRQLSPGEEVEVGIAFGPGLIQAAKPDWQKRQESADVINLIVGVLAVFLLVGGLVGVVLLWYLRGRDPEVGLVAEYLSEPPADVPPGVAGTLVDERADMQDVIASLVDLARRGYLEMIETQKSKGLFGTSRGSEFTFRRTDKAWDGLLPFEKTILDKIFGDQQERSLEDLQNMFYTAIPKIKQGLYQQTVAHKFFRSDPETVRGRYAGMGIGLLVVAGGIGFFAFSLLAESAGAIICPFISVGLVAVAVIIAGQAMPVKTRTGAEEAAKWKAFKRYLQEIERYAKVEEATDQFDRFLPYAIAFGLERSWINKFAAVPSTPVPMWYYPVWMGPHRTGAGRGVGEGGRGLAEGGRTPSLDGMSRGMGAGLSSMSAGLTTMLNSASSTLTSRPQSSGGGGGGWSGGGFSGGGGGGGGSAGFG